MPIDQPTPQQQMPSTGASNFKEFNEKVRQYLIKAKSNGASNKAIENTIQLMTNMFAMEQKQKITPYQQAQLNLQREKLDLARQEMDLEQQNQDIRSRLYENMYGADAQAQEDEAVATGQKEPEGSEAIKEQMEETQDVLIGGERQPISKEESEALKQDLRNRPYEEQRAYIYGEPLPEQKKPTKLGVFGNIGRNLQQGKYADYPEKVVDLVTGPFFAKKGKQASNFIKENFFGQ